MGSGLASVGREVCHEMSHDDDLLRAAEVVTDSHGHCLEGMSESAVSSRGTPGFQLSMHCTEGELFCSIYLLTPRTFEGWLKGLLTFSELSLYPRRLHARVGSAEPEVRPSRQCGAHRVPG